MARIVVAAAVADATGSLAAIAAVVVGPAVAAVLVRGATRSFAGPAHTIVRVGALCEAVRATCFGIAALTSSLAVAVAALLVSGALAGPVEGALGASVASTAPDLKWANSWLRASSVSASIAGALAVGLLGVALRGACAIDAVSFVASGCSLLVATGGVLSQMSRPHREQTREGNRAVLEVIVVYCGVAFGLALCAASMVHVAAIVLRPWTASTRNAYSIYSGAIAVGALVGGAVTIFMRSALQRRSVFVAGALVSATLLLLVTRDPAAFLVMCTVSACAETLVVIELNTRVQSQFPPSACADMLWRIRVVLGCISVVGVVVNVVVAAYVPEVSIAIAAAAVGVVVVIASPALSKVPKLARAVSDLL